MLYPNIVELRYDFNIHKRKAKVILDSRELREIDFLKIISIIDFAIGYNDIKECIYMIIPYGVPEKLFGVLFTIDDHMLIDYQYIYETNILERPDEDRMQYLMYHPETIVNDEGKEETKYYDGKDFITYFRFYRNEQFEVIGINEYDEIVDEEYKHYYLFKRVLI